MIATGKSTLAAKWAARQGAPYFNSDRVRKELAGLPAKEGIDSQSLVPLLKGRKVDWRQSFLYEAPTPCLGSRPLMALCTRRYKLIQTYDLDESVKVVFEELYDLRQDSQEIKNLTDDPDYSTILERLRDQLKRSRSAIKP